MTRISLLPSCACLMPPSAAVCYVAIDQMLVRPLFPIRVRVQLMTPFPLEPCSDFQIRLCISFFPGSWFYCPAVTPCPLHQAAILWGCELTSVVVSQRASP